MPMFDFVCPLCGFRKQDVILQKWDSPPPICPERHKGQPVPVLMEKTNAAPAPFQWAGGNVDPKLRGIRTELRGGKSWTNSE